MGAGGNRSRRDVLAAITSAFSLAITHAAGAEGKSTMKHVALLGDSVFDNSAYIAGGPDVVTHLRQRLPPGWRGSLLANDGGVMNDVPGQLARLPSDASHLVISIGGNDALRQAWLLNEASHSVSDSLTRLAAVRERFKAEYAGMLETVARRGLPTAVCTIYDPRYPNPAERLVALMALMVINDCIIREAGSRGLPIIDLRVVCDDDADFANPIEPSVKGGFKIAGAIVALLGTHDFSRSRSEIFSR
ncbi:MAG: hypothetical protein K0R27_3465 [Xanthobacteraceae bacterium]|nr:hypothetical protein [Xanthobacteraceae bacterium]